MEKRLLFFMIIGILTSYLDFLTFPLVGLYFPMIFMIMKENNWKKATSTVIGGSIMWIVGYGVMWCGKWIVGSLLTGVNIFADAFARAGEYTGASDISYWSIILKNIFVLVKWPIVILGCAVIIKLILELRCGIKKQGVDWRWVVPFSLIILAPFVWYLVAGSHSHLHYWYTYRELCVAIFGVMVGIQKISVSRKSGIRV